MKIYLEIDDERAGDPEDALAEIQFLLEEDGYEIKHLDVLLELEENKTS